MLASEDSGQIAQSDLSRRCAHMSEGTFSHVEARIITKMQHLKVEGSIVI